MRERGTHEKNVFFGVVEIKKMMEWAEGRIGEFHFRIK